MMLDLDRLAALEAEATSAPWVLDCDWGAPEGDRGAFVYAGIGAAEHSVSVSIAVGRPDAAAEADAALIAEARNALLDLIASSRRAVELEAENERLRTALAKINRLRSNVIATQSASWSNLPYPLVAILDEAGYEVQGATDEQIEEHLHCYGGAGHVPTLLDETPYESPIGRKFKEEPVTSGSIQIHAERYRQQHEEGWTPKHDDEHNQAEMPRAAHRYLTRAINQVGWPTAHFGELMWPWDPEWWKPSDDPVRNLVKAGALIAAEIDRLQRKATGWSAHTEGRDES